MTAMPHLERALRKHLPHGPAECLLFVLKQGWACLFGGLLLLAVICTKVIWSAEWPVARYDALFLLALTIQLAMLLFRLETLQEAKVILLFHLTGTAMEIFKIDAGSWTYPEPGLFKLWGVPMFSGFMYASVGSYIARVIRILDMRFTHYPPFWATVVLATLIYVNFFSHHYIADMRLSLMAVTIVLFARSRIWFSIGNRYWMPLPAAAGLASLFLWIAENIGTLTGTWVYAGRAAFDWTSLSKIGSWYLLLYVAFVTVTLVIRDPFEITQTRARSAPRSPARQPRAN